MKMIIPTNDFEAEYLARQNKYLVFITNGEETFTEIMIANEIFNRMDMDDCTGEYIKAIYLLKPNNKRMIIKAEFHGTWHDWTRPLYMSITVRGKVVDSGYGTDH